MCRSCLTFTAPKGDRTDKSRYIYLENENKQYEGRQDQAFVRLCRREVFVLEWPTCCSHALSDRDPKPCIVMDKNSSECSKMKHGRWGEVLQESEYDEVASHICGVMHFPLLSQGSKLSWKSRGLCHNPCVNS